MLKIDNNKLIIKNNSSTEVIDLSKVSSITIKDYNESISVFIVIDNYYENKKPYMTVTVNSKFKNELSAFMDDYKTYLDKRKKEAVFIELIKANPMASEEDLKKMYNKLQNVIN